MFGITWSDEMHCKGTDGVLFSSSVEIRPLLETIGGCSGKVVSVQGGGQGVV